MAKVNETVLMRYEVLLGFNTKQWWIYDNERDVYIDPPIEVLEKAKQGKTSEEQQDLIYEELFTEPTWLDETEHHYHGDIDI